jgi:hypothetical protein
VTRPSASQRNCSERRGECRHEPLPEESLLDLFLHRGNVVDRSERMAIARKAGILAGGPEGEPEVGAKFIQALKAPGLAAFVLSCFHGAKLDPRPALGFRGVETGANKVSHAGFDVEAQPGVHIVFKLLAAPDPHDSPGIALSTPATTDEKSFQRAVSALSCLRPEAVSV